MSNNKNSQWLMRMLVAATVNNSVRNRQTFSLYDVYFYLKRFILDTLAFFPNLVLRLVGNEWPPNATFFRKNGIYFILVLLSPLLAETVYKVATKKKRGQTSYIEKETQKRMRTLKEIINDETLLFEEEEEEAKAKAEKIAAKKDSTLKKSTIDGESNSNLNDEEFTDGDDDDDDDDDNISDILEDKHTKIDNMMCAIDDIEEIDDEVQVLHEAYCLSARMMGRELKEALEKTVAQNDEEFSDGEKLKELVETTEWIQTKLVGTPWTLEEFYRNPTKYFFGEKYMAYTTSYDQVVAMETSYNLYLKDTHKAADLYLRENEKTWMRKSVDILFRFPKEIPLVGLGYLFSILTGTMSSVSTLYESELINTIMVRATKKKEFINMERNLFDIVISMLVAHLVETLLEIYQEKLNNMSQTRMGTKLQQDVFHHILQQDVEYYDLHDSYDAMHYVSSAKTCLFWLLDTPNNFLNKMSQIITSAIILLRTSKSLFLILMGSRLVQMAARGIVSQYTYRIRKKMRKGNLTKSFNYYELLNPKNFRTVRSHHREPIEHAEFVEQTDMNIENNQKLRVISQVTSPVFSILDRAPEIFALYYGGTLVMSGELRPSDLVQLVTMGINCVHDITSLVDGFGDEMYTSLEDVAKVADLLNRKPKIGLYEGLKPNKFAGHIKFDNVQFTYPSRKGTKVLKNLSFEAEPGHLTALVGPSGAGKSTVMGLLERFYDPNKGSIKLDGIDIKDINPLWLRQQMAIVPQEPILFNRSIRENMVYGCKDEPPMEEIEEAAKAANIYDFITTKCAEKWRTEVGKGGVKLSGGQKQRLAIARAILKKPKLLLLDEATSALDQESEGLVQEALDRLMEGRTTIAIAHRLSTIRNASKIICIKDGAAIEEGTHDELMKENGLYCKYWSEQIGRSPMHEDSKKSNKNNEEGEEEANDDNLDDDNPEDYTKNQVFGDFRDEIDGLDIEIGKVEEEETETKRPGGDKTPPRTPKSINTHFREKFIRLQNKYEMYIHGAKQGNVNALDEIDRVFRDLNFLFTRVANDIDREEAFGTFNVEKTKSLTMSEPRARHNRDIENMVPPPAIQLRRTKSYNNDKSVSISFHPSNINRSKTPGNRQRGKHPPAFFNDLA